MILIQFNDEPPLNPLESGFEPPKAAISGIELLLDNKATLHSSLAYTDCYLNSVKFLMRQNGLMMLICSEKSVLTNVFDTLLVLKT